MIRKHGSNPYNSIFVHGGPGAAGELYDMCEVLSRDYGILETLHEGLSVDEQIEEVNDAVQESGSAQVNLLGHSWGAWLVIYYAVRYPEKIKRIILLSSGPFEDKYVSEMNRARNERFSEEDLLNLREYFKKMNASTGEESDDFFQKAGRLFHKIDSYDEIDVDLGDKLCVSKEVYEKVWPDAAEKRTNGELMKAVVGLSCPVTIIHGDFDPHPYEGVRTPFFEKEKNFDSFLLRKCGHNPWREKAVKDEFYTIMDSILK